MQSILDRKEEILFNISSLIAFSWKLIENTYNFDLIIFYPIHKHIRAIFLNATEKPIDAILAPERGIRFVLQPLQFFRLQKPKRSKHESRKPRPFKSTEKWSIYLERVLPRQFQQYSEEGKGAPECQDDENREKRKQAISSHRKPWQASPTPQPS